MMCGGAASRSSNVKWKTLVVDRRPVSGSSTLAQTLQNILSIHSKNCGNQYKKYGTQQGVTKDVVYLGILG
jgi:hypothetical protein